MRLYADLHIQIIDYRQILHFLPIYCELSDNLKKDFLLSLYHTHLRLSTPNICSSARGMGLDIFKYIKALDIFKYIQTNIDRLATFAEIWLNTHHLLDDLI